MADPTLKRCFIEVQAPVEARDPVTNESRTSWIRFRQIWCSMEPDRSNERFRDGSVESSTIWTVRADYYDGLGIKAFHRIVFDGRVFNIRGLMPDLQFHRDWMAKVEETDADPNGA